MFNYCLNTKIFVLTSAMVALLVLTTVIQIPASYAQMVKTKVNILTSAGLNPEIAASGNNVFVVWHSLASDGGDDIFFKASTDNGVSFGGTVLLGHVGPGQVIIPQPKIAASGNNILVVWHNSGEIYGRKSVDAGARFIPGLKDPPLNLSNNPAYSSMPDLAVYEQRSHGISTIWWYLAWNDEATVGNNDITFKVFNNSGRGSSFNLSLGLTVGPARTHAVDGLSFPQVAAADGKVYVAWPIDAGNAYMVLKKSANYLGSTFPFTNTITLDTHFPVVNSLLLDVAGSNVYAVWEIISGSPSQLDIFFKRSPDWGVSFEPTKNLSNDPKDSSDPYMAASSNVVDVVWTQTLGNGIDEDIYEDASRTWGSSFLAPTSTPSISPTATESAVAKVPGCYYLVWRPLDGSLLFQGYCVVSPYKFPLR